MSVVSNIVNEPSISNDNSLNLFDNELTKREDGIEIDFSNSSEREAKEDKSSQLSSVNLSTPSYKSYFIGDENSKDSCKLADLLFLSSIYILCEKCNENYSLKFQNLKYVTIKCGCKLVKNCLISQFIFKYCAKKPINYGCKWHNGEKTDKFCINCQLDVCKFCLTEKSLFYNDSGKHTKHETHDLIDLLDVNKEIEEIKKKLLLTEKLDNNDNIKNILENLINDYYTFPSYNSYKTIKKLFKRLPFIEPKNEDLNPEKLYIIKSLEKLKKRIDNPNSIYKIRINGEKTKEIMEDLSLFAKKDFNNLKILTMNNIKLKDISGLSNCSFPNLKVFDLESNEITNDCIKVLKAFELPKVLYFSLFDNKITTTEILEIFEKYTTLKVLYIGKNPFDENIIKNDKKKYKFPPDLEIFGMTNSFTKETNNFIFNNLNIENVKILFIYANGFTSLEQLEQVEFKRLEDFWFRGNINKGYITDIKEINHLKGKEKIKKLILKENKINNIEELVKIVPSFPNLQLINLEDNPIDADKIEEVLGKIKKIKGFEKFHIIYNQKHIVKKINFITK